MKKERKKLLSWKAWIVECIDEFLDLVKVNQQEHFGGFKALKWPRHVAKDDKKTCNDRMCA
jgi:hypothetical protein